MSIPLIFLALLLPATVQAHGQIESVSANWGNRIPGPNIYYPGDGKNRNTPVRTMYRASGPAFTVPRDYGNSRKMACEEAGPAPGKLTINAGGTLNVYWQGATGELDGIGGLRNYHPFVHAMGPVLDYITPCTNGDCTRFDPTNAPWTKLAASGLDTSYSISNNLRNRMSAKPERYYPNGNGVWGLAKLLEQGSRWDITIPRALKNGEYIVRTELAAVHSPLNGNPTSGPQHYIACIQIKVTNGGNSTLTGGTTANRLYSSNGNFARINVYSGISLNGLRDIAAPGPSILAGFVSSGNSGGAPAGGGQAPASNVASGTLPQKTDSPAAPQCRRPGNRRRSAGEIRKRAAQLSDAFHL